MTIFKKLTSVNRCVSLLGSFLLVMAASVHAAETRKILLIAGPKSHGPVGNGVHDYPWSVRLLKAMLESSNVKDQVRVEYFLDGWPKDEHALDDAATIVVISDGRDGDQYREAPHLETRERVAAVDKLMRRGCGLVTIHFSNFAPDQYADKVLDWTGGFFDWETDGQRQWYSAITTIEAEVKLADAKHPILNGVKPFRLKEEFYYNLRLAPDITPILNVPALNGRAERGNVTAWAHERAGGGRGFGTTCGHFYDNWKNDQFRKLVLNAIVWTAHVEAPTAGVDAKFLDHAQIEEKLGERRKTSD